MSKTMLDSNVVEADKFMDLKPSTRDLYTHILLATDDEGFVSNPKSVVRKTNGADESDLETLIEEGYLIRFPSKVLVVTHYWVNNKHDTHNNKPSMFKDEKALIYEDETRVYRLKEQSVFSLETDCKELTKEPTIKERTNQPTNQGIWAVGLSGSSIYNSLSCKDSDTLRAMCEEHNCDLRELITLVDNSIRNRKEQTKIPNPFRNIVQVAENVNWNPAESSRGFVPPGNSTEQKTLNTIDGRLWDHLTDEQQANMKVQYSDRNLDSIIKSVDAYITEHPEEEWKGSHVALFKKLADKVLNT